MGRNSNPNFMLGLTGNIFAQCTDFTDKIGGTRQYMTYMLNRTQKMFKWEGLPDTIPKRNLELMLQTNGNVCVTEVNGDLYAFTGGLGGEPNAYYMPTIYTVANPALNFFKNLKIGEECVVIPNDPMYVGLLPMFSRYATMLAENDASIRIACINSRLTDIISASDDVTHESALRYLKDIEMGKLGIVAENSFLDGVKVSPASGKGATTDAIELQQYLKASWFNDLGLSANYNMKREAINSQEAQIGSDSLLPLCEAMLESRQTACEFINQMYGTNISVDFASSWEIRQSEEEAAEEELKSDDEMTPEVPMEGDQEDEQVN